MMMDHMSNEVERIVRGMIHISMRVRIKASTAPPETVRASVVSSGGFLRMRMFLPTGLL